VPVFYDYRNLRVLRPDVIVQQIDQNFPYLWLLTQDSKAYAFARLLFAMRPWYASEPRQLDGARVATVNNPVAVSRACGLFVLLDASDRKRNAPPQRPNRCGGTHPCSGTSGETT
jgi:hypothetical protein